MLTNLLGRKCVKRAGKSRVYEIVGLHGEKDSCILLIMDVESGDLQPLPYSAVRVLIKDTISATDLGITEEKLVDYVSAFREQD